MKPHRIILIRHGKSEGNASRKVYLDTPDYAVALTEEGKQQALEAGKQISSIIGKEATIQWYVSPYWRTRLTFHYLAKAFIHPPGRYYEDVRLREQEWQGKLPTTGFDQIAEMERDNYSTFYYRFKGGESVADVIDRVGGFLNTMHRDFEKTDFPENCVVVTHGMTLRAFLMRWCHMTVEEFEAIKNPRNCEFFILERQDDNKYKLITPLAQREVKHKFKFEWPKD